MSETLDARGRRCSLLSLMIAEHIADVTPGSMLEVLTDDPGAATEIPSWCRRTGHELLAVEVAGDGAKRMRIRKSVAG
jgi:tRNA 2-thiouridine synthesizing protein A